MKFAYEPESRPLDGFTIKRAIYRGGFGEVYYGLSDAGREVALKLLQHNTEVELRGVQQCLNLSHPNLVKIFDVRQDADGDHWIIMEYVAGETLDAAIRRHPSGMPVEMVRKWLPGIVAGASFLHSRGLVHRDLKPANIFMEDGTVKVGDVGLSKFITVSRRSAQTQSVGTVYYMAPEVARGRYGKEVDVYAVGVIVYEMLTGQVPFVGESTGEILMKHLTEKPDLERLPPRLRGVIGRALHKEPERRYAALPEFLKAFDDAITGRVVPPEVPSDAGIGSVNSALSEVTSSLFTTSYRVRFGSRLLSMAEGSSLGALPWVAWWFTRMIMTPDAEPSAQPFLLGSTLGGLAGLFFGGTHSRFLSSGSLQIPGAATRLLQGAGMSLACLAVLWSLALSSRNDSALEILLMFSIPVGIALTGLFRRFPPALATSIPERVAGRVRHVRLQLQKTLDGSPPGSPVNPARPTDAFGTFSRTPIAMALGGAWLAGVVVLIVAGQHLARGWVAMILAGVVLLPYLFARARREQPQSIQSPVQKRSLHQPRLATYFSSSLLAVPLTAIFTGLLAALKPSLFRLGGTGGPVDLEALVYFGAVSLLGVWTLLAVPSRIGDPAERPQWGGTRALLGAAVGAAAWILSSYLLVEFPPTGDWFGARGLFSHLGEQPLAIAGNPTLFGYSAFFAALFGLRNWPGMMSSNRNRRFRIGGVAKTLFVVWLLTRVIPFPLGWACGWGAVIACTAQLASPWDETDREVASIPRRPRHRCG